MFYSEQIDKLMPAVVKAWASIEAAVKNSTNPHLKNHYADLSSLMDAIKKPMADNGLAVFQPVSSMEGDLPGAIVETYIMHTSGQWMMSSFSMVSNDRKPQAIGATITYARRYALGAMLGMVAEEDDDGNSGSGTTGPRQSAPRPTPQSQPKPQSAPAKTEPAAEADNDTEVARQLRNKLMELTGTDMTVIKQYFKGIWPDGSPKESAPYVKPLNDAVAYVARGEKEKDAFKADPVKFGELWASHNGVKTEADTVDVSKLADTVAKKHGIGTGVVLLKTIDKLFKDVADYKDESSMVKFLNRYMDDAGAFDELKASAALGISLKDMMANG